MVDIKHLCLCLLFSSTHFSIYKDTFAFYKDTKCVQGHAILMPGHSRHIGTPGPVFFAGVRVSF